MSLWYWRSHFSFPIRKGQQNQWLDHSTLIIVGENKALHKVKLIPCNYQNVLGTFIHALYLFIFVHSLWDLQSIDSSPIAESLQWLEDIEYCRKVLASVTTIFKCPRYSYLCCFCCKSCLIWLHCFRHQSSWVFDCVDRCTAQAK